VLDVVIEGLEPQRWESIVGADALLRVEEVKLDRCVLSRAADRSGLLDGAETAEPTLTDTSPGE